MRNHRLAARTASMALAFALISACSTPTTSDYAPGERIGTYDGRALAIAYAASEEFQGWLTDLHARHKAAKSAGDDATAAELEAKAIAQQETLHGQAFRGESVDDILGKITGDLAGIRDSAGVTRLERINERRPSFVETVDVTDELVALFDPNEKALRSIRTLPEMPTGR